MRYTRANAVILLVLMLSSCSRSVDVNPSELTTVVSSEETTVAPSPFPTASTEISAVAVHPDDERYTYLHGRSVWLPIVNKAIPVVEDSYVDVELYQSDSGMPLIEVDQYGISVVDDDHVNLKTAVESICDEYGAV